MERVLTLDCAEKICSTNIWREFACDSPGLAAASLQNLATSRGFSTESTLGKSAGNELQDPLLERVGHIANALQIDQFHEGSDPRQFCRRGNQRLWRQKSGNLRLDDNDGESVESGVRLRIDVVAHLCKQPG